MKFSWCTIIVRNLEESLKFYQEIVGLTIQRRFPTGETGEIVFLGDGETKVELISKGTDELVDLGRDISLGFEVDSLDEMISFVKEKGFEIDGGPVQPNPHVRFFYIKDPDGLRIQFVENM